MSTIQLTIQHTIQRAYKTELDLNHQQTTACKRHAGAARWAYNWGLATDAARGSLAPTRAIPREC